jgi:hypothetical protein
MGQFLTVLTQLRSLCMGYGANEGLRCAVGALRHMRSSHLQDLTLNMFMGSADALDDDDAWPELSLLIETSPNFKGLHTLTFRFWGFSELTNPGAVNARERWIGQRFPLCLALGVLHVEHGSRF